jgi:hypothetical protein
LIVDELIMAERLTDEEINLWWHLGNPMSEIGSLKREPAILEELKSQLSVVKKEIDKFRVDPYSSLIKAIKTNQVLMFGEQHFSDNPQRLLLARILPELKRAGATHLAVEDSVSIQPQLDQFVGTNELDPAILAETFQSQDYLSILREANKAGLKIVAVDLDAEIKRSQRRSLSAFDYHSNRDKFIATQISKILASDADNKVVWTGGAAHCIKARAGDAIEKAAAILDRTHAVFSVRGVTLGSSSSFIFDIAMKTMRQQQTSNKLIAIMIKDSQFIASMRAYDPENTDAWTNLDTRYGQWDMIILHP